MEENNNIQYYTPQQPQPENSNNEYKGTASLVCGIISLSFDLICCGGFGIVSLILGVIGLILGLAKLKYKSGMAIAGVILSIVGILGAIACIILLIASIVGGTSFMDYVNTYEQQL